MKMIKSLILVMALIVPNTALAVVKQSGKDELMFKSFFNK